MTLREAVIELVRHRLKIVIKRSCHHLRCHPRSGHRTCSSSIENRHQTKFVITYGVIREAVIELVRHRL
jgi:hypothetical protein